MTSNAAGDISGDNMTSVDARSNTLQELQRHNPTAANILAEMGWFPEKQMGNYLWGLVDNWAELPHDEKERIVQQLTAVIHAATNLAALVQRVLVVLDPDTGDRN